MNLGTNYVFLWRCYLGCNWANIPMLFCLCNEIKCDVSLIPAKNSDVLIGQASPYSARYYFNFPLAQDGWLALSLIVVITAVRIRPSIENCSIRQHFTAVIWTILENVRLIYLCSLNTICLSKGAWSNKWILILTQQGEQLVELLRETHRQATLIFKSNITWEPEPRNHLFNWKLITTNNTVFKSLASKDTDAS